MKKILHSRKPSTAVGDHVELIMYLRRKPGTTRGEFYEYWQNTHAKLIALWAEKHGVISYKQVSNTRTHIVNMIELALTNPCKDPNGRRSNSQQHPRQS
jgi:hypothetical protein